MNREEFHDTLRRLVRREPFEPFLVKLTDDKIIDIIHPDRLVFNGGKAIYLESADKTYWIHAADVATVG